MENEKKCENCVYRKKEKNVGSFFIFTVAVLLLVCSFLWSENQSLKEDNEELRTIITEHKNVYFVPSGVITE